MRVVSVLRHQYTEILYRVSASEQFAQTAQLNWEKVGVHNVNEALILNLRL